MLRLPQKLFLLFVILFSCISLNTVAQGTDQVIDKDLWFTWIEAKIEVNGEEKWILSKEIKEMTCCVRSKKFRRYLKKVEKDIQSSISSDFKLNNGFKKLNNESLAKDLLKRRKLDTNGSKIIWFDLKRNCFL